MIAAPLSSAQFSDQSANADQFHFDPNDIASMFTSNRSARIQAQQSMKASIKDFSNSTQPTFKSPITPKPPMAG